MHRCLLVLRKRTIFLIGLRSKASSVRGDGVSLFNTTNKQYSNTVPLASWQRAKRLNCGHVFHQNGPNYFGWNLLNSRLSSTLCGACSKWPRRVGPWVDKRPSQREFKRGTLYITWWSPHGFTRNRSEYFIYGSNWWSIFQQSPHQSCIASHRWTYSPDIHQTVD